MADEPAEVQILEVPETYPNIDGVSLEEKRRVWCIARAIEECAVLADVLKYAPEWDRWLQHGKRPRIVEQEQKE